MNCQHGKPIHRGNVSSGHSKIQITITLFERDFYLLLSLSKSITWVTSYKGLAAKANNYSDNAMSHAMSQ